MGLSKLPLWAVFLFSLGGSLIVVLILRIFAVPHIRRWVISMRKKEKNFHVFVCLR